MFAMLYKLQNLLVRQSKTFLSRYVVFLILQASKLSKLLKASQERRHCFVITSAPKQIHGTKPNQNHHLQT